MRERIQDNNRGFSLIELIVTVLTGILMMAVGLFMSTTRNAYQTVNTSATLQEESLTVERVLSEFFMEAKAYGFEENVEVKSYFTKDEDGHDVQKKVFCDVLWMLCKDNESLTGGDKVYFFALDKEDKTLRYCTANINAVDPDATSETITVTGKGQIGRLCYGNKDVSKQKRLSVIGTNIESLAVSKSKSRPDGSDLIVLNLTYSYMNKTYSSTVSAVTRNKTHDPVTSESGE